MLAQLEPQLPRDDRWAYEPKFDGFRGRLWRRGDASAQLFSRNGRDLAPWFPELTRAADILPRGTFRDGEIVIADEAGQADFGALQHRLTLARKFIRDAVMSVLPFCSCSTCSYWPSKIWGHCPTSSDAERSRACWTASTRVCNWWRIRPTFRSPKDGWPSQDSRVSSPNGSIVRTCLVESEIGSK